MFLHPQCHQQVHTGDCRRARAGNHHANVGDIFLDDAQAVEDSCGADDSRTVLIVMEHRNVHTFTQFLLNVETFRCFDIFQVDAAEGWLQCGNHVDKFVRVGFVHLDVENINTGELLEQNALAFHYGFTGERADIPQPEHRGTV